MNMEQKKKIIIVDDHEIFRKGFTMIMGTFPYIEIIAEATDGEEFLKLIDTLTPDLVFMDIKMPNMNGIEATAEALKRFPKLKIVALSIFGEEKYLQSMMEAGVIGFILKNVKREELEIALKLYLDGHNYYSEELLAFFTQKYISKQPESNISNRELEVMQLIAKGLTNQEIADQLFVSLRTVEYHKTNLIQKTGSKNVVDLLLYAIKNKLIDLE